MERRKIILLCDECLSRNYTFYKSQASDKRIELKKYCSTCNKHTLHKETR